MDAGFHMVPATGCGEILGFCPAGMPEAYAIPFRDPATGMAMLTPDGKPFVRLKLQRSIRMGDNDAKYLSPLAGGTHVFIPKVAHQAALGGSPITITEGEKKALSATLAGISTFGLTGVFGGLESATGAIHPDLGPYLKAGREVTFVLDSDAAINVNIALAAHRFNAAAVLKGCCVKVLVLPAHFNGTHYEKAGMDDILVRDGVEQLREILAAAEPLKGTVAEVYCAWMLRFCAACKTAGVESKALAQDAVRKGFYDHVNSATRRKIYQTLEKDWPELVVAIKATIRAQMESEFSAVIAPEHGGENISDNARVKLPGFEHPGKVDSIEGDVAFCFEPGKPYCSRPFFSNHLEKAGKVLPSAVPAANADIRSKLWTIAQIPKLSAPERSQQIAEAVLEWLHGRGRFYFHVDHPDFASVMYFDAARKLLLPVQSDSFQAWLSDCLGINRADRTFSFIQSAVETEGLSERATAIEPSTFWAARPGVIYLSSGPGHMARVSAGGVTMVDNGVDGVLFPCGATLAPWNLTDPVDPFEGCRLFRDMSTSAPHGRDLFDIWTMSLPTNQRTKPPLVISGDVGSGKTRLIRGVFELFGIPDRINAVLKDKEDDFWSGVNVGGLSCADNADTKVEWFPDALAIASTGGSREKRKLYTDSDNVVLKARAWICVTSANPSFASDAGLADRLLVVRLDRRKGNTAETTLSDEIVQKRDAGLSYITYALSRALADEEPVPGGLNKRHPDFAQMAVRIGRAVGRGAEVVMALMAAEADKGMFSIENDNIGAALLELVHIGPFKGTAAELVGAITRVDPSFMGKLSPKTLSKRMAKLWPHLERVFKIGQERDNHTKMLIYTLQPPESAVFAVIEKPFPVNSLCGDYIKSLPKVPSETPQTPQIDETRSLIGAPSVVVVTEPELDWNDGKVRVA